MATNFQAFTYCWTDKKTQKLYIGVHKGEDSDGYICSCKIMLEEFSNRPHDFSRQIIARGNYEEMIVFETALLRSADAARNPLFYNGHNGDGNFYNKGHSELTKQKLKIARNKRTDKPRLGKPLNDSGKIKAAESAKKRLNTEEGRSNVSKAGKISAEKRLMWLKNDPEYAKKFSESVKRGWETRRMWEN